MCCSASPGPEEKRGRVGRLGEGEGRWVGLILAAPADCLLSAEETGSRILTRSRFPGLGHTMTCALTVLGNPVRDSALVLVCIQSLCVDKSCGQGGWVCLVCVGGWFWVSVWTTEVLV